MDKLAEAHQKIGELTMELERTRGWLHEQQRLTGKLSAYCTGFEAEGWNVGEHAVDFAIRVMEKHKSCVNMRPAFNVMRARIQAAVDYIRKHNVSLRAYNEVAAILVKEWKA